jgi:hypothetical protein
MFTDLQALLVVSFIGKLARAKDGHFRRFRPSFQCSKTAAFEDRLRKPKPLL